LKKLRLVITGNPGVGKHTSANIIAEKINAEIIRERILISGLMLMSKSY
jgi:nucleoside-triphosphatase THEP1